MPSLFQSRFARFHEAIELRNTEEDATLREKRDAVLQRLRDGGVRFEWFDQGSYAVGTGVVPVESDYDIDVGLVLDDPSGDLDPKSAKQRVFDAVSGHTPVVEWRRHCIRVQHAREHGARYHVDLAVYRREQPGSDRLDLAVGRPSSSAESTGWLPSDPKGLAKRITEHLTGEDHRQLCRVIRYLKRWRDVQFPTMGHVAPVGVGLTAAALLWFRPVKDLGATTIEECDDLAATLEFVDSLRANFRLLWNQRAYASRLVINLPVPPGRDVFERMTNQQMLELRQRLDTLARQLGDAARRKAAAPLVQAFGPDFPSR